MIPFVFDKKSGIFYSFMQKRKCFPCRKNSKTTLKTREFGIRKVLLYAFFVRRRRNSYIELTLKTEKTDISDYTKCLMRFVSKAKPQSGLMGDRGGIKKRLFGLVEQCWSKCTCP